MLQRKGFFGFQQDHLQRLLELKYQSKSHTFNRAVIASYNNVAKYGFTHTEDYIRIDQSKRSLILVLNKDFDVSKINSDKKLLCLCESPIYSKKTKEVCYNLDDLFSTESSAVNRGIKFSKRPQVTIADYHKVDQTLDEIYNGWKHAKETDGKTFLIAFNPARYHRSYVLKESGYNIYQKLILINKEPYALINFAIQDDIAYELSFLSLFYDKRLKLVNDQNDSIMIHSLYELYKLYGIKNVNLGTAAGIKGLAFFKKKFPFTEKIVYSV